MIDQATVDKIFETANIEEVVGEFVELRKRGVNLIGCCPFHNEKTPSFTVSAAKGIFKCFGCGEGGNAVSFIMKHERLSYGESLRYLAKKYHIEISEEEESEEEQERRKKREGQQILLNRAKTFFVDQLMKTDVGIQKVLPFFESRGFRKNILERFEIGFTGLDLNGFIKLAQKEGYKKDNLLATGLAIEEETFHDYFQRRIIFPIFTASGRIAAFYGRKSRIEENESFHLYSEENPHFDPERDLFGLYQAKNAIVKQKNLYLTDQPFDVLYLHLSGLENSISQIANPISEKQLKAISRFTTSITLFGHLTQGSFHKLLPTLRNSLQAGFSIKVIVLPKGESLEELLSKKSATEIEGFFERNILDWLKFASRVYLTETTDNDPARIDAVKALIGLIAQIPNSIVRGVYVTEMSNHFDIDEQILNSELQRQLR